jgi:hypothetical protein
MPVMYYIGEDSNQEFIISIHWILYLSKAVVVCINEKVDDRIGYNINLK